MIYTGGLTFIVHFLIIIVNWIIKKPLHFLIIIAVFVFTFGGLYLLSSSSIVNGNISYIRNTHLCVDKTIVPEKKYIILRLDDVQSSYLRDLQMKMINEGLSRGMPFTTAVIPLGLEKDEKMLGFLKQNSCNIEVAQHGFNNRYDIPEFQGLSSAVASDKMERGLDILNNITKRKIITFIPPNNVYSKGTAEAAEQHEFKIISGEGEALFDYSASTYDFENDNLVDIDEIMHKVELDTQKKGFAIIMLHPQDYVGEDGKIDPVKYNQFIELLDNLEQDEYGFTTIYNYYYGFIKKNGLDIGFYDSRIKGIQHNRKGVDLSSIDGEDDTPMLSITRYNYNSDSKIIYSPEWIRKYNYITNDNLLIRGRVEEDIDAVYINDYRLNFFEPGDDEFNYSLHATKYENLDEGRNDYHIYYEKDGKLELKETIVFFYYQDETEFTYDEEALIKQINESLLNTR